MKQNRINVGLLAILLLMLIPFQSGSILLTENPRFGVKSITAYVERGPIEILNDSAFVLYGFEGSGTSNEPYLIEGLNITSDVKDLITIKDTTKHFKIIDSILNCLGNPNQAIYIDDAANGTIENNTISNSFHGDGSVQIVRSEQISIINNTIHDCELGIMLMVSDSCLISNNTIYNAVLGTTVIASDYNILHNNTVYDASVGLLVGLSDYNLFSENTIQDIRGGWNPEPGININAGIYVESSYMNNFIDNKIFSCSYEGIFVNRSINSFLSGNTIYNCLYDGIIAESSNNLTLEDNTIHDCGEAIILINCNNSLFNENTIFNMDDDLGIYLESGNNNTFSTNGIYNSAYGIYLESGGNCDDNIISGNTIYNISEQGIYLRDSDYNTLSGNTIFNCTLEGIYVDTYSMFNTLTDNTVNNCDIGIFIVDSHNNTVMSNLVHDITEYGIAVFDGDNNTLSGNTVYNCQFGIIMISPDLDLYYNIVTNNFVYSCLFGINLGWSHNCTIMSNVVYDSNYGINLDFAHNNTISYNIVYNNTLYGLSLHASCEDNTVTMNNFGDNNIGYLIQQSRPSQAYDNGFLNDIYSNYWSDWNGTGNYPIDGQFHINDTSPLMNPILPTLRIVLPIAQEYETDTITVVLSGNPIIVQFSYYIEGIDVQNKTWTTSEDRTLPDGTYTLHAYGSDITGNTVHEEVIFTIDTSVDTTTTTTTTTTTVPTTILDDTFPTTTKTGSSSELVSILIFLGLMSIFIRKRKKR